MNILFVYPSTLDHKNRPVKYRLAFLPPLSLAILAALTPARHRIAVVNDLVENIDFDSPYDLVAMTVMTTQADRAYQVAAKFRARGVPVVLGGFHPSILPDEAQKHANSVVIGEAENLWEEVLHDAEKGTLKPCYQNEEFSDLSRLFIPRWDLFNLKIYPHRFGAKLPRMPIFFSRGCPFSCKFCTVNRVLGKSYRTRPIAHVLAEIEATPAKEYFFVDDNITCNPDYSRELFSGLKGKGKQWISQASTTILQQPELLDMAAQAGCSSLFVGVESLNQATLETVNKGFNKVEEYEELLQRMRRARINPILSFIFGFDTDLPHQFPLILEFLRKNKIGYAAFWILTPGPGSDLYTEMKEQHRLLHERWSLYDGSQVVFRPFSMSPEELHVHYWLIYKEYYSWPSIIRNIYYNVSWAKHPWEEFLQNVFLKIYFKRKVESQEHPYSGGFFRLTTVSEN